MEDETARGIQKFKDECQRQLTGVSLVIPVRPTQGAFLVSFSAQGMRTYGTIHEDDFADWGEASEAAPAALVSCAETNLQKLRELIRGSSSTPQGFF